MGKSHLCAAEGCENFIPLSVLCCRRHWFMVPKALRDAIWEAYVPGQEHNLNMLTEAYMAARDAAVAAVAEKEGRRAPRDEEADA